MRRSPFVLAGTAAGLFAVLGFHTQKLRLAIPTSAPAKATSSTPGASASSTSPTTANPAISGPNAVTTTPATTPPSTVRTLTGSDTQYPYGDLAVTVTVSGTKITKVALATLNDNDSRSSQIDGIAIPILAKQVLAAGSVHITGVSGATYTSQAYVDSVQSALDKLHVK